MEIYPAVDIRGGRCVRLTQGDYSREEVFSDDPVAMGLQWFRKGAARVHVVDLDGARRGKRVNLPAVAELVQQGVRLQVGGGIRTYDDAVELLDLGVQRIILGTAAVRDPELRRRLVQKFGGRVLIGVDCRNGQLAVQGWEEQLAISVTEFCRQLLGEGVGEVILTDIERDGMLTGPNVDLTRSVLDTGVRVIASGGVGNLAQLRTLGNLSQQHSGLTGVIVGRALYAGAFTLEEALETLNEPA